MTSNCVRENPHFLLLLLLMMLTLLPSAAGAFQVEVQKEGRTMAIAAHEENGIVYVSLSELALIVGGSLDWDMLGHRILYKVGDNAFYFVVESPFFKFNDRVFNMTFEASLREGQLYVPAATFMPYLDNAVAEQLFWNRKTRTIRIESDYFNVADMTVEAKANGLLIEILLSVSLDYEAFTTEGNWLNVTISGGRIDSARVLSRLDRRYMYKVSVHQAENSGQLSMRLRRHAENWSHRLLANPPRIQITITDPDFALDTAATPIIGPDDKIDVIVIDPGHGGKDYGAIGPGGTREKNVVLEIARELARLIRTDKQFKVVMTRDRDEGVSLEKRAGIANKAGCDLFVSIHANASPRKNASGWNVFFLAPANNDSARAAAQLENSVFLRDQSAIEAHRGAATEDNAELDPVLTILNEMIMTEFQSESYDFAEMLSKEMLRRLRIPARGVDMAAFFVLNQVYAPSVLVETGFISNPKEEKLLASEAYQKAVAQAIYDAIKKFKATYEKK